MEHIIHPLHRILQRALVANVTDVELNLVRHLRHPSLEIVAHVILLLLVTREDADLADIRPKETVQHRFPETTGATGDQQGFILKKLIKQPSLMVTRFLNCAGISNHCLNILI